MYEIFEQVGYLLNLKVVGVGGLRPGEGGLRPGERKIRTTVYCSPTLKVVGVGGLRLDGHVILFHT